MNKQWLDINLLFIVCTNSFECNLRHLYVALFFVLLLVSLAGFQVVFFACLHSEAAAETVLPGKIKLKMQLIAKAMNLHYRSLLRPTSTFFFFFIGTLSLQEWIRQIFRSRPTRSTYARTFIPQRRPAGRQQRLARKVIHSPPHAPLNGNEGW